MRIYLDTSALVKLVVVEPESMPLREFFGESSADARFSAALARTEFIRAVARQGSTIIVEHARRVLAKLDPVNLNIGLLDTAAVAPSQLRTRDAIHLAAALTAPDLRALVTYDQRMADAATAAGITVVAPR